MKVQSLKGARVHRDPSELSASSGVASGATRCPVDGCTGYLEPTTDNAGTVIDRPCQECARRAAVPHKRIERCALDGCPGKLHVSIVRGIRHVDVPCAFCDRRAKWRAYAAEKGIPAPPCDICGVKLEQPGHKWRYRFCALCTPVADEFRVAPAIAEVPTPKPTPTAVERVECPPAENARAKNADRDREIVQRYLAGEKLEAIGQTFGIHNSRVAQIVRAAQVERRGRGRRMQLVRAS